MLDTETLKIIVTIILLWSGLTMAFPFFAPAHVQSAKTDRLAGIAEKVFVAGIFALLALFKGTV